MATIISDGVVYLAKRVRDPRMRKRPRTVLKCKTRRRFAYFAIGTA